MGSVTHQLGHKGASLWIIELYLCLVLLNIYKDMQKLVTNLPPCFKNNVSDEVNIWKFHTRLK